MTRPSGSAVALLRRAGLRPEGPVYWTQPPPTRGPGIYVVELREPLAVAPVDARAIAAWLRRVHPLTVDAVRATGASLAARLASFWIPSASYLVLPFANLQDGRRARKRHGIGGARLP